MHEVTGSTLFPAKKGELRALFPISLDNPDFRTNTVLPAIRDILRNYSFILFLVANDLQLYNKADEVTSIGLLKTVFADFEKQRKSYFDERYKWLMKVINSLGSEFPLKRYAIRSVADFTDRSFYEIYRKVLITFYMVPEFRIDVERIVGSRIQGSNIESRAGKLSRAYILEEIALNIRIRLLENITGEFYIGTLPRPLINIHNGSYKIDAWTLAGLSGKKSEMHFYELDHDQHWNEVQ
jgi:hypothetical protein